MDLTNIVSVTEPASVAGVIVNIHIVDEGTARIIDACSVANISFKIIMLCDFYPPS